MASANLLLVFALISVLCVGSLASPTLRIIGGSDAKSEEFPYIASVRYVNAHTCGGSIISPNHVLTAAHCVSDIGTKPVDPSEITVRVGSKNHLTGGTLVAVREIFIHESYGSFMNDLAVLRTDKLPLSEKVQPIELASKPDVVTPGQSVLVAGWGRTQSNGKYSYKLQHYTAKVLSATDCNDQIGYGQSTCLCLKNNPNTGSCNGDAGGPIVTTQSRQVELVGVSTFVIGTCATKYPDMAERVTKHYDWIMSKVNSEI